ncbi:MAG: T9SS type A sorting domain-containing protein [Ignavibacteria bacterium]|nr:T9SS type A sorting domain-containing protein [Ignavibacteria bacterium]
MFKFNKLYRRLDFNGYACVPILLLFAFNLSAQDFHTIDFDSTSTFFKNETTYSKRVENTVIQVVSDIEQLINPKYNNQIRIKVSTIEKKIQALAYIVPKYENVLLFRNGITTGRVWQKYNTTNINPNDLSYDCELFINTNYEYNTLVGEFDNNKYDLYSIILHEYIHSLGFFSMITKNGESIETNYEQGIFSLFDTRLQADGNQLISFNTANLVTFNSELKPMLKDECAISYLLDLPIVFSPSDWQNGSSISHLDTNCLDKKFAMMPSVYKGQIKRTPLYEDLYVLSTLGYYITGKFRGDTILTEQQISDLSSYYIPIANNDFIDTISVNGNNIFKIPASLLISNDEHVENFIPIQNEFIKFDKASYNFKDTLELTLARFQNPYQFNYYSKTVDGFISNPARVNIVLPIEDNSVGECKRDNRNLLCNGDFEQVTTIGQLKLLPDDAPNYLYNRDDTYEPCVPSKYLAGWNLSWTPDVITYINIDDLTLNNDPNFSTKYKNNIYFKNYYVLKSVRKPNNELLNNFFVGMFSSRISKEKIYSREKFNLETISQSIIENKTDELYRLSLDLNSFSSGTQDTFHILFSKNEICEKDSFSLPKDEDFMLLSNRLDYNITNNSDFNHGLEWKHLEFNNLELKNYNYLYIFSIIYSPDPGSLSYYLIDNISLRPMSYGLIKQELNYNFCDIGTIDIPIKIEKEIEESDTLLVKVANSRLSFETEGKTIIFDDGTKDTIIHFSATYNDDYRYNPEYIVDIEFESTNKGDIGKENITLTINNNDLEVEVYADNYCNEDSLFFFVDITQKSFNTIDEGRIHLFLPKNFINYNNPVIIENTLDPEVHITTISQTENLESIYKINLNNTLAKSTVHGIDEDLKLIIRFAVRMELLDSLNIIKTVTNLFADGCEKTRFDTIYSNQLRNRIVFNDTTLCNSLDLSYLESREIKVVQGNDIDDLTLTKSGDYVVSYTTVEDCVVLDTFNLNLTSDFYLESNIIYSDSTNIQIRIEDKIYSETDSIREFKGRSIYKIYPVLKASGSGSGAYLPSLSPSNSSYQVDDTLFIERNYDIINTKFNEQNSNYQNILVYYPKSDSIVIESSSNFYNGCENKTDESRKVIYLKDTNNRIYDYQLKERVINIYPNPTDRIINLEFEVLREGQFSFHLFDLLGRELYSDNSNFKRGSYKKSIDISDFVNGTYSLMIVTPENSYFKKFMIFK